MDTNQRVRIESKNFSIVIFIVVWYYNVDHISLEVGVWQRSSAHYHVSLLFLRGL